ncbi:ABC transporter substrate-binding protein [Methylopila musalis]|uniref:ABC transporter substrate-binding protein n=1 Tax=Methylopila musalis TaxID=1134781 RepID=A0ABW3ZA52_9HYPH
MKRLATGLLLLSALWSPSALAQAAEPCIGASLAVTGPAAFTAKAIRQGAETAIDEINERGGVLGKKLRLVVYDDAGAPPRGIENVRRIAQSDNCIAVLGGFHTGVALALRDHVNQIGIPYVGVIAAGTAVTEFDGNKWLFRVSMKDRLAAAYLADAALERSPAKKVALLYENTGFGQGAVPDVTAALEKKGLALVGKETFNWNDADMTPQLIRLRDAGADAIILYSIDREANQIVRGLDKIGWKPVVVSAWGNSSSLGQLAGPLANGLIVAQTFSWLNDLSPKAQTVWTAIAAKSGLKDPSELIFGSAVANAYDALNIIGEAIRVGGAYDRTAFRDALFKVRHEGLVRTYDPAFADTREGHDALTQANYILAAWHDGVLKPLSKTPYK